MKYYIDAKDSIFAYESDEQKNRFNPTLTAITEVEKDELLKPAPAQIAEARKGEILARLTAIDSESIRPLRAIATGTQTAFDADKLSALDAERATLADELAALSV